MASEFFLLEAVAYLHQYSFLRQFGMIVTLSFVALFLIYQFQGVLTREPYKMLVERGGVVCVSRW